MNLADLSDKEGWIVFSVLETRTAYRALEEALDMSFKSREIDSEGYTRIRDFIYELEGAGRYSSETIKFDRARCALARMVAMDSDLKELYEDYLEYVSETDNKDRKKIDESFLALESRFTGVPPQI